MSYPVALDEVSDLKLVSELTRRQEARAADKCAYCGYKLDHSDYPGRDTPGYGGKCLRPDVNMGPLLTFDRMRVKNTERLARWHGDSEAWTGADWSNAMGGEAGEMAEAAIAVMRTSGVAMEVTLRASVAAGTVANTIKKIRRHETGLGASYNTPELEELRDRLAAEIADVVIYADLLAEHYGIDLGKAVVEKFNKVSVANGFPERL